MFDLWRALLAAAAFAAANALPFAAVQAADGSMSLGPRTNPPIGHYRFCGRHPEQCRPGPSGRPAPLTLDASSVALLATINAAVNKEVAPASDDALYGRSEYWTFPDTAGDCEDYALEKQRRLVAAGIAPGNLLLTVVRKASQEGHAVLTVRTDRGDYVLDNLDPGVRPFFATPYLYLKRQSSTHPGRWVEIEVDADVPVASLQR